MKSEMVTVVFMTTIHLPRFTMKPGDTWQLRASRIKPDGFTLGNGFVKTGEFKILGVNYE